VTWQFRAFKNEARADGLQLCHWSKCYKDASGRIRTAQDGEYPFVKFSRQAELITYTDEEYNSLLSAIDLRWSRAETDYLMGLCVQFGLRFNVIADRYEFQGGPRRSMEDMKARYFSLARALLIAREGGEELVGNVDIIKNPYNYAHELDRKRQLALAWARSTGIENAEDTSVLEAASSIEAHKTAAAGGVSVSVPVIGRDERAGASALANGTNKPDTPSEEGIPSLFSPQGLPVKPSPGIYSRGAYSVDTGGKQVAGLIGGTRAQKTVDVTLAELGIKGAPCVPTRAVCGAWLSLRAEVIQVLELKKKVQTKQGSAGSLGNIDGERQRKRKSATR